MAALKSWVCAGLEVCGVTLSAHHKAKAARGRPGKGQLVERRGPAAQTGRFRRDGTGGGPLRGSTGK